MSGVKLNTAGGGSVLVQPASSIASDVTVNVPSVNCTLLSNKTAGTVLQVVSSTYSTQVVNNTSTMADTGLTATITPTSTTSKILIVISHSECEKTANSVNNDLGFQLQKNGSTLIQFNKFLGFNNSAAANYFSASFTYMDSPASTAALTYKTQFCNSDVNGNGVIVQANGIPSTITLMEIAA